MLKNALIFAAAALIIGLSAPALFSELAAKLAAPAPTAEVSSASPAPTAADAAAADAAGRRQASIAADAFGQYRVDASIEGERVAMLVDTGATMVALAADTAARLGVVADPSRPKLRMRTANGDAFVDPVVLRQLSVGPISLDDVEAVVMPRGAGDANLLGASFLKRLSRVEQRDGALVLEQ